MEKIESFRIDHNLLKSGVYVSRVDKLGDYDITTYDLRVRSPYDDAPLTGAEAHTIEHICATWLRNKCGLKDRVVYFGPMGCLTGFYMILAGAPDAAEAAGIAKEMFEYVAGFTGEIPGASRVECGNYLFMDLPEAKKTARRYVDEVLTDIKSERLNYPTNDK